MLDQRALTAIGLRKYRVLSMICYIGMGWAVLPFAPQALEAMGTTGFGLLLSGGIAYTLGSILYGIGAKKKWLHSVFHIFVKSGFLRFCRTTCKFATDCCCSFGLPTMLKPFAKTWKCCRPVCSKKDPCQTMGFVV